jgi:hypothetical protein
MDPEERRKRMQERMQSMSPEEREQFVQRMRERGVDPQGLQAGAGPGGPGAAASPGGGGQGGQGARAGRGGGGSAPASAQGPGGPGGPAAGGRPSAASAQTIDSLFGPLPPTETSGRVWLYINNQLKPVRLRLGISDGTYTELISGDLESGNEVVTNVTLPAQAASSAAGRSPLMGPSRGPGGPPPGVAGGGGSTRPAGR